MKQFGIQNYFPYVPISNQFIENYMLNSNPNFVIIYIYILKKSMENKPINLEDISNNLNLLNSDILRALQYWEQHNLIKFKVLDNIIQVDYLNISSSSTQHNLENININDLYNDNNLNNSSINNSSTSSEYTSLDNAFKAPELDIIKTTIIEPYNPNAIPLELQEYNNTSINNTSSDNTSINNTTNNNNNNNNNNTFFNQMDELKKIFKIAENKFGKTLSFSEEKILAELYNDYNLTTEILALIFTYCSETDQNNIKYAKTVAFNWLKNNITTTEKAEIYLNAISQHKKVLAFLGINKKVNIKEEALINKWFIDYDMPLEVIEKACEISLLVKTNGSLSYTDGILKNWFDDNINTLNQLIQSNKLDKLNPEQKNNYKNYKPRGAFFNSTSYEITDELIQQIENQYFN